MRVLGIDPGYAIVGFGVLEAQRGQARLVRCGAINTPAGVPMPQRLVQIQEDLETLIHQFAPDVMAIEELFFSKNITTGIPVAHARGVILLCAFRCGVPVYEYTPMQVKQAVVGFGMAEIARSACAFAKRARLPQAEDSAPMRVSRIGSPNVSPYVRSTPIISQGAKRHLTDG